MLETDKTIVSLLRHVLVGTRLALAVPLLHRTRAQDPSVYGCKFDILNFTPRGGWIRADDTYTYTRQDGVIIIVPIFRNHLNFKVLRTTSLSTIWQQTNDIQLIIRLMEAWDA